MGGGGTAGGGTVGLPAAAVEGEGEQPVLAAQPGAQQVEPLEVRPAALQAAEARPAASLVVEASRVVLRVEEAPAAREPRPRK